MRHDFIDRYSRIESPIHALDPRAKAAAFFALIIICVSTPNSDWWAFVIYATLVLVVLFASGVPLRYFFSRLLIVLPFILLVCIFLPFMHKGGGQVSLGPISLSKEGLLMMRAILLKSLISVSCLILLSSTTQFADLLHGLEKLYVPRFLTTVSAFMYRYLFLLVDEAQRIARARDSRNYKGKWIWQVKTTGYIVATLFLRSQERAERVYQAMVSRGFEGEFPRWTEIRMRVYDYAFAVLFIGGAIIGRMVRPWS
ncbi:MAG: cobalt ECF transporter T component CbiQ [Actinomycetota bacterium]|nr:cobalt ECF transporter T component CbiQ [Actinomycetota bacterium]